MTFHEQIIGIATSRDWAALGINFILSSVVGGIIILILLVIFSKAWKEQVKYQNAFIMVLLINLINIFGILTLVSPYFPSASLILPVFIWIGFTKLFFSEMRFWHAIVVGIIGFALSIFLIPNLVGSVSGFVPTFSL